MDEKRFVGLRVCVYISVRLYLYDISEPFKMLLNLVSVVSEVSAASVDDIRKEFRFGRK